MKSKKSTEVTKLESVNQLAIMRNDFELSLAKMAITDRIFKGEANLKLLQETTAKQERENMHRQELLVKLEKSQTLERNDYIDKLIGEFCQVLAREFFDDAPF
jgi:hypothetical protein